MKDNRLKYIAYVRKSEEREERQMLSVQAQIRKIKEQFADLKIVEIVEENKSAFKPQNRPVFASLIERINSGEIHGIIAWHPNRLSRNEIDAATVTYMLRKGELKDLKFCTFNFDNTAEGIMMLQMVLSQSQYESAKQGRDVKRGMEQMASNGERPGQVPQGYIKLPITNDYGDYVKRKNKYVTETRRDPERYDLVLKMWKMLLSGRYNASQVYKIATEDWQFTTHKTARIGGGAMSKSLMYKIFNNPFYAGYVPHNGELHKGKHDAMINLDEFDYAQKLLGKNGKSRTGVNDYAFTGLIKCGECGCQIVGKTNRKFVKREGQIVAYVHYYCTRKSMKRPCSQSKYTRLEVLENEIEAELSKYEILPEFRDMALDILRKNNKLEVKDRSTIYATQQKQRQATQEHLDKLIDMRARDLLDDEEYLGQRSRLKLQRDRIDDELRHTETRADDWLELTERAFNFVTYAPTHFRNGSMAEKRDILMTLGENLVLKDNKLTITPNEWLIPIAECYPAIQSVYEKVRTNKKATSMELKVAMEQIFESWRARRDLNPRHPA
jgi:site-specific DNA recombinase